MEQFRIIKRLVAKMNAGDYEEEIAIKLFAKLIPKYNKKVDLCIESESKLVKACKRLTKYTCLFDIHTYIKSCVNVCHKKDVIKFYIKYYVYR